MQLKLRQTVAKLSYSGTTEADVRSGSIYIRIKLLLVMRSASDLLQAHSSLVKFVEVEAAGQTPYIFYKPTMEPKYVCYRPYNEFITPTTFI